MSWFIAKLSSTKSVLRSIGVGGLIGMGAWALLTMPMIASGQTGPGGDPPGGGDPDPEFPVCTGEFKNCETYPATWHMTGGEFGTPEVVCKRCVQVDNANTFTTTEADDNVADGAGSCGERERAAYNGPPDEEDFDPTKCGSQWVYHDSGCGGLEAAPCAPEQS